MGMVARRSLLAEGHLTAGLHWQGGKGLADREQGDRCLAGKIWLRKGLFAGNLIKILAINSINFYI